MTDPPTEPTPPPPPTGQPRTPTLEQRVAGLGREAHAAGERLGRQAEAAGQRLSKDPAVIGAADTAGRIWGLIVLAVGVWFFADITLGLDMPSVAWRDLWPVALIVIGLVVVIRGMARRRA
jgi:hypothetical protein